MEETNWRNEVKNTGNRSIFFVGMRVSPWVREFLISIYSRVSQVEHRFVKIDVLISLSEPETAAPCPGLLALSLVHWVRKQVSDLAKFAGGGQVLFEAVASKSPFAASVR